MRSPISPKKLSNEKKAKLSENKNVRTLREGYACSQLIEPLPKFNAAQGEEVKKGQSNHYIVFGRDRPRKRRSGYGGSGDHQASSIDIVVGRMASDIEDGIICDNNFVKDAARIYICQKTDIDSNFNLSEGKKNNKLLGVPHSVAKSAIGIKADAVRLMAREGIKLVTRVDEKNSAGDDISADIYGIDLIAGNNADWLQPIPKGDNLQECIDRLHFHIDKIAATVYGFMTIQNKFNKAVKDHQHISPFFSKPVPASPGCKLVGGQAIKKISDTHMPDIDKHRANLKKWNKNYLKDQGDGYILSRYNKVN